MFLPGETVYIIVSSRFIKEATVLRVGSGFYTIKFKDGNGGTRLRESRLFRTKKEAEDAIKNSVAARYK